MTDNVVTDILSPQGVNSVFVARQAIYDKGLKVWGHELLFRATGSAVTAGIQDPEQATAAVIVDGFPLGVAGVKPEHRLAINFTRKMLLEGVYDFLPPKRCIADVPSEFQDREYLDACRNLKSQGFLLATQVPAKAELLKLADVVRFDLLRYKNVDLDKAARKLKTLGVLLLAQRIETRDMLQRLMNLGFDLFQGYVFSKPMILPGQKLHSTRFTRMRILGELASPDYDVAALARILSTDVGLSYRLLRFINSPFFGLRQKITSIAHAVSLLGQKKLRHWLMAAILSEASADPRGREMYFISIKRARLLELLAEKSPTLKGKADSLFMLGLFSKLDVLLSRDMRALTEELGLDDEIADALCRKDNVYGMLLTMIEDMEEARWDKLAPLLERIAVTMADVAVSHNLAILWAAEMTQSLEAESVEEE